MNKIFLNFLFVQPFIITGLFLYVDKSRELIDSIINISSKSSTDPMKFLIFNLFNSDEININAQSGIIASVEQLIETSLFVN